MMEESRSYLRPRQAAAYLGFSEAALRRWRRQGCGPRFFNANKLIRYRRADLDGWIEAQSGKQAKIQTAAG